MTTHQADLVLAVWRAVDRQLAAIQPGTGAYTALLDEQMRLRLEYQLLTSQETEYQGAARVRPEPRVASPLLEGTHPGSPAP